MLIKLESQRKRERQIYGKHIYMFLYRFAFYFSFVRSFYSNSIGVVVVYENRKGKEKLTCLLT